MSAREGGSSLRELFASLKALPLWQTRLFWGAIGGGAFIGLVKAFNGIAR